MSAFGGLVLTNKGRILQAKAQAGTQLLYTRIGVGDGQIGSTPIADLSKLKNEIMSLPITKLKVQSGSRAIIGGVLDNNALSNGFYFRELGIFARDPDAGEILYCYGNAGALAEYIPAGGGADLVEKAIDVQVLTGNAANVSAVIDQSLIFETPTGAQEKADKALKDAKDYTDNEISKIPKPDLSELATKQEVIEHKAIDATDAHNISNITGLQGALDSKQNALSVEQKRRIFISSTAPTNPQEDDIWIQV